MHFCEVIHSQSERQLIIVNQILHRVMDLFPKISGHSMPPNPIWST